MRSNRTLFRRRSLGLFAGVVLVGSSLVGCSSDSAVSTTAEGAVEVIEEVPEPTLEVVQDPLVTEAEYGDAWPFAVNEGTLRCFLIKSQGIADQPAAVISLDGNNYALNGVAIQQGYTELTLESDVWLDNPGTGAKVSIGPLVAEAVALCDTAPSE